MKPLSKRGATVRAACGTTMWGVGGVLANLLFMHTAASPAWLVSMRLTWAGILLLGFGAATHQPLWRVWQTPAKAIRLIVFGVVGVALAQLTYLLAIQTGNAAIATIMLSLVPMIITGVVCLRQWHLPRRSDAIAIGIALIGVVLLVTGGHLTQLQVPPAAIGWGALGAVTGAAYTMVPRPLVATEPPLVVVGWGLVIGAVLMNVVAPVWRIPAGIQPWGWAAIAFIVLGATLIAYILYVTSLTVLAPASAAMIENLEPLTATLLSILFLALGFHRLQLLGIALVLGGIALMNWTPQPHRHRVRASQAAAHHIS
ncbi:DMT family transporter [Lacticaseibacillus nasuensis]|nr:EamA family transporter [Lacticaseibacillus nasuensis]